MKPHSTDGSLLRNVTFAGLICCALLGLAWWKSTTDSELRVCQVCSVMSYRKTISIYGLHAGTCDTKPEATIQTTNYFDRYLAYPHAHDWLPFGKLRLPTVPTGSNTFIVLDLTRIGYQLVAASGIPEPERRRLYFESIIHPPDERQFPRIVATWRKIAEQHPEGPYGGTWFHARTWSPEMEGVVIPDEVKAGRFLPDPDAPPPLLTK